MSGDGTEQVVQEERILGLSVRSPRPDLGPCSIFGELVDLEDASKQSGHCVKRDFTRMRLTERRVHRNPAADRDGRQLGDETALPDARRRRHSDDGPRVRDRPVKYAGQRGQLPLAANQSRVATADRPVLGHAQ